jgi:DNA repair exonuclease SbcCD ATPase subunit
MKINKLTASFGKLNNDTIEFTDGLNVVRAPNESGKSTWCAFIRDMLYGVDSSERTKSGYLPDKVRYAPWSGAPMEGTMELTAGGKDVTITRTTRTKSGPMREFSAVYTGTNVPVPGLDGLNAGEELTGVPREVFRRSAFVEQGGLAVSGSPELEKRIAAIVTTGEEGMSYSEADERLRSWQRSRRFNHRGRLPELEDKIGEARRGMESMDRSAAEREELSSSLLSAEAKCGRLEQAVTDSRKRCRRDALENLTKNRAELGRINDSYNELYNRSRADRAALEHSVLGKMTPDEAAEEVRRDKAQSLKLREAAEAPVPHTGTVLFLVLAAVALAAMIWLGMSNIAVFIAAAVAAAGGAAGAIVCLRKSRRKAAEAAEKAEQRAELLSKYGVTDEDGMTDALEEFRGLYAACMASEQETRDAGKTLDEAKKRQEELENATLSDLDFSNGGTEAARLGRELGDAKREKERLSAMISRLDGGMEAMGDPVVVQSSIESMENERAELQREYDAISMAVEALKEADSELQSRFSPALGRKAAEYMSVMTGGKYNSLLINRDFTAKTGAGDGTPDREAEYLSAGTLDLMYLAVRLAVCELALPQGEKCPLILDDALVNFDPVREAQAMKLLDKLSQERQVILFSCRTQ